MLNVGHGNGSAPRAFILRFSVKGEKKNKKKTKEKEYEESMKRIDEGYREKGNADLEEYILFSSLDAKADHSHQ